MSLAHHSPGAPRRASTSIAGVLLGVAIVVVIAVASSTPGPTLGPTPRPTLGTTPRPTAGATPRHSTTPTPASTASQPVRVTSIPALLSALDDNAVTEIVVADGTYRVSPAASQASDSLWIGARFADRTHSVIVRAETPGGVTFDGGGTTHFGCISFQEGAHDQVWDGFRCAGGQATATGVVMFGGYAGAAAPHHITLRRLTIDSSCTARPTAAGGDHDQGIYLSKAIGGPHDLLFEDVNVDGQGGLASAFHFHHSDSANRNAWNVTVRRLTVSGTQQAVILWDSTLKNITFETANISGALRYAVRHEAPGATGIVYAKITSTGSGAGTGFYSSQGDSPAGVTFVDNSFK